MGTSGVLRADYRVYTEALTRPKSCQKNGDRPKFSFLLIGSQRVLSAGGIQNIDGFVRMRFGIGLSSDHTLEQVGQQFSVTRERIRQIE
jgi:hypothetical protein